MPKAIMHVETGPASPAATAAYHEWYEAHVREIVATDGVVGARRFAPQDGDGRFLAIYEIVADDVAAVRERISTTAGDRTPPAPGVLELDPPPTVRWYDEIEFLY